MAGTEAVHAAAATLMVDMIEIECLPRLGANDERAANVYRDQAQVGTEGGVVDPHADAALEPAQRSIRAPADARRGIPLAVDADRLRRAAPMTSPEQPRCRFPVATSMEGKGWYDAAARVVVDALRCSLAPGHEGDHQCYFTDGTMMASAAQTPSEPIAEVATPQTDESQGRSATARAGTQNSDFVSLGGLEDARAARPWLDEGKPIMVGVRPNAVFFDEPSPGDDTYMRGLMDGYYVIEHERERAEAAESRLAILTAAAQGLLDAVREAEVERAEAALRALLPIADAEGRG